MLLGTADKYGLSRRTGQCTAKVFLIPKSYGEATEAGIAEYSSMWLTFFWFFIEDCNINHFFLNLEKKPIVLSFYCTLKKAPVIQLYDCETVISNIFLIGLITRL